MAFRLALLFFLLSIDSLATSVNSHGFRASLIRTKRSTSYSHGGVRSRHWLSMFMSRSDAASSPVSTETAIRLHDWVYLMEFSIGTPEVSVWAQADTGSDLIWLKCSPCTGCKDPPRPLYDPKSSSTFSNLSCGSKFCGALPRDAVTVCTATQCRYHYRYGLSDNTSSDTRGTLGTETITVGGAGVPGVGFGCSDAVNGSDFGGSSSAGLVGLGKGSLSMVTQLGSGRFSYCLSSDPNVSSPLLFGAIAKLSGSNILSTRLITNPTIPSAPLYYVNLTGISVGGRRLPIPGNTFDIDANTGQGGVVVDSGSVQTWLVEPGYGMVKQAVLSQMTSYKQIDGGPLYFDLCFQVEAGQDVILPSMVMHFDGADMHVQPDNYFKYMDLQGTVLCMTILPSPSLSLVGNIMQMNHHILFDVTNSMMSFQAADCSKL